jgi:antitoxin component YwqK of YwqJK toxin-antitoxin module
MKRPSPPTPWLCAGLLAAALALVPAAARTADNSDVAVVDADTPLAALNLSTTDQKRVKEVLATLPEGRRLEVECKSIAPDGTRTIRFVCRLTAIDAAGKADGPEVNFADWYRRSSRVATYRAGELDGLEQAFDVEGGYLLSETPWVNGRIHGVKRTFHPNGELANETTFEKGLGTGTSRSFGPDGQLTRVVLLVKGERHGEATDYWLDKPDAVERVIPYRQGQVHGLARAFYLSGQLKWERPFKDNRPHGVEKQYAADGTVDKTLYWWEGDPVSAEDYRRKGGT